MKTATATDISKLRIAVIGAGKMGGILIQAFLAQKLFAPEQILATVAHADRAAELNSQWGIKVTTDNVAAAGAADLILLGVKPFQIPDVMEQIRPALTANKALLSFAASVKTSAIEDAARKRNFRHPRHAQHAFHAGRRSRCALSRTLR